MRRHLYGGAIELTLDELLASHVYVEGDPPAVRPMTEEEARAGHPGLTDAQASRLLHVSKTGAKKMRQHRTWGIKFETLAAIMDVFGVRVGRCFRVRLADGEIEDQEQEDDPPTPAGPEQGP